MNGLTIDIRTVMRLLGFGSLFAIGLLLIYKKNDTFKLSVRFYILGKMLQAPAWFFLSFRGSLCLFLSNYLANFLLVAGISLEMIAFSRLSKRRKFFEAFLCILPVFCFVFLILLHENSARVVFISVACFFIYMPTGIILLRQNDASRLQNVLAVFILLFSVLLLFRSRSAIYNGITLFSMTSIQTLTYLAVYGLSFIDGTGFLLLLNEKLENNLLILASSDPLTGILNRRSFFQKAQDLIGIAGKKQRPLTFLMLDIDFFKSINDMYGHGFGDTVLKLFSDEITGQLYPSDLFGRIGGEEFVLIINDDDVKSRTVAERIRRSIENMRIKNYPEFRYTVSIGLFSCIPKPDSNIDDLLRKSDIALYEAKKNGRNKICVFSEP